MSSSQIPTRRGSSVLRPSRSQTASSTASSSHSTRRKKSRSPEASSSRMQVDNDARKRKEKYVMQSMFGEHIKAVEEAAGERGRKSQSRTGSGGGGAKHKSHHSKAGAENATSGGRSGDQSKKSRKEQQGQEWHGFSPSKGSTPERADDCIDEDVVMESPGTTGGGYSGPLAAAEFTRLKADHESTKKNLHGAKKMINKQGKVIDELRQELTAANKLTQQHLEQLESLRTKSKNNEELISTIDGDVQCQICLDYLLKPFVLSPCGHVFCVGCLQSWFKTAPPQDDDMYDEDDPDYMMYRRKTCPTCRAVVRSRPIPLFFAKRIASSIVKAKTPGSRWTSPPPDNDDPWKDIFPKDNARLFPSYDIFDESTEEDVSDEDEEDEDMDDDDDDFEGYGTASDEEPYEGGYVDPKWAPPTVYVDTTVHVPPLSRSELALLRRGATLEMIAEYDMAYSHRRGITVRVEEYIVYLGWNLPLHPQDPSGSLYIEWVMEDIANRWERWRVVERRHRRRSDTDRAIWKAYMLVPEGEGEDDEYSDTDTEAYIHSDDEDEGNGSS